MNRLVERSGNAYIGWLGSQLERAGLNNAPANQFAEATGKLVGRNIGRDPDSWEKSVSLEVLAGVYDEFKSRVEELAANVYGQRTVEP